MCSGISYLRPSRVSLDTDKPKSLTRATRSYRLCVLLRSQTASLLPMSLITSLSTSICHSVFLSLQRALRIAHTCPKHYTLRCYLIAFGSWVRSGFKQYLLWEVFLAIPDRVFTTWFHFFFLVASITPCHLVLSWVFHFFSLECHPMKRTLALLYLIPLSCITSTFKNCSVKSIIISCSYIFKVCGLGGGDGLVPK